jgi:glycosyltransferase involved in cell wall biosynthesis
MQNKKVTIALTSYNQAKYITQALDSALSQDYPNLEIVIGDDASTDETDDVIKPYLDNKRVKYIKHERNLGQIANKRKLFNEHATGDYILFIDGDDFLADKTYLTQAVKLAQSNNLAFVFTNCRVLIEQTGLYIRDKVNADLPTLIDGNWLFLNYHKGYSIANGGTLYDREHAMKIGFYEKEYIPSWDWEFNLKLVLNKKVGFINNHAYVWRKHDNNVTKNADIADYSRTTLYIDSLYAYVLSQNRFDEKTLISWKNKMLKRVFFRLIVTFTLLNQKNHVKELFAYIKTQYGNKLYYEILFDLRLVTFRLLSVSDTITHWAFKHILGQESFFLDLVADRKRIPK